MFNKIFLAFAIFFSIIYPCRSTAQMTSSLHDFTIHLFFQNSGIFSEDITSISDFMLVNFNPIGYITSDEEGELVFSFLIKLIFYTPQKEFNNSIEITSKVVVIDKEINKVIFSKDIDTFTDKLGFSYFPVFIDDNPCGPFIVKVISGSKIITKELPFYCVE